jgi:hypothetical protein
MVKMMRVVSDKRVDYAGVISYDSRRLRRAHQAIFSALYLLLWAPKSSFLSFSTIKLRSPEN